MFYFTDDTILNSKLSNTYLYTKFDRNIDYLEYVPSTTSTSTTTSTDHINQINFTNLQINEKNHYLKNNQNLINFIKYLNSNPDYKLNNYFYHKRLQNICWRRIYQNYKNLKVLNPLIINWDKNSDITWLYGPKIENEYSNISSISCNEKRNNKSLRNDVIFEDDEEAFEDEENDNHTITNEKLNQLSNNIISKDDDEISVSSLDSDSTITSNYSLNSSSRKSSTTSNLSNSYYEEELKQSLQQIDNGIEKPIKSCLKNSNKSSTFSQQQQHQEFQQESRKVSFNYIINMREIIDNISLDYNFLDRNCV
ncbi:uncharacterized protein KGF55_004270 [Candida pseudojiufengensis]|uniref:uncharacterized protein n=1 Tax=Candida pseudojiufengensis TaxID=497109 RepID=UPI002224D942|nr:uncharacterized protein KGF55_004270 [Candida pseudojiufengensis]KAI5961003.1 hypothetical protein KGF55_004270 [Candida pseudojiufengensis]